MDTTINEMNGFYEGLNDKVNRLFTYLGYPENDYDPTDIKQPHHDGQEGELVFPAVNAASFDEMIHIEIMWEKTEKSQHDALYGAISIDDFLYKSVPEIIALLEEWFPDQVFFNSNSNAVQQVALREKADNIISATDLTVEQEDDTGLAP